MGLGLASFAAGFGGGYMAQQQRDKENKLREDEFAIRKQEADNRQNDINEAKTLKMGLANAVRPASVEQGGGGMLKAPEMDNRDVGLAENASLQNQGLSLSQYRTAGKNFDTQADADTAAAAYNAPQAQQGRLADVYRASGKPMEAMQFESATRQAAESEQNLADKKWRSKLGEAMMGGHEGVAGIISKSDFGPMKGKKAQAVPSEDGKSVTYNTVGEDGTLTPVPSLTFSNDQTGVTQAAYMLDKAITPEHRHTGMLQERKIGEEAKRRNLDRDIAEKRANETERHNSATEENSSKLAAAAMISANSRGANGGGDSGGHVHSTFTDKDGNMVATMKDGTSKYVATPDGKPIKSQNLEKRIDALAKNLQANDRTYRRLPYDEVRKAAQELLSPEDSKMGLSNTLPPPPGAQPASKPRLGLSSAPPAAPASSGKPNFSTLWN